MLKFSTTGRLDIIGFSDVDWAYDHEYRKFVSGNCVLFGGNQVFWGSRKQKSVARSSIKSEYRSLAQVDSKVAWISSLLSELHVKMVVVLIVWCNNQGATALAYNPVHHGKTKHIDLDVHFIRDMAANQELQVRYNPSQDQVANVFTKALTIDHFEYLRNKLNVIPSWQSLRGDVTTSSSAAQLVGVQ